MEKGSLLEEALHFASSSSSSSRGRRKGQQQQQQQQQGDDNDNDNNKFDDGGLYDSNNNSKNNNILILDVFLLPSSSSSSAAAAAASNDNTNNDQNQNQKHLLNLANLAKELNDFITCSNIKWHYGGDGPIFGICVSDDGQVPHVRAELWYGYDSQNEWTAIDLLCKWSCKTIHNIAISCWDISDNAPLLLIELSGVLPDWVDDSDYLENLDDQYLLNNYTSSLQRHRYTCWICNNGQVKLIKNSGNISLTNALNKLSSTKTNLEDDDNKNNNNNKIITTALTKHLESTTCRNLPQQRTPMILPRKVVALFKVKPNMIHTAIQSYCEYQQNLLEQQQQQNVPMMTSTSPIPNKLDLKHYEDWVWTIQSLSKTNYAMLRTINVVGDENNNNDTTGDDKDGSTTGGSSSSSSNSILPSNWSVNVEVKRYQRKFGASSGSMTPHLQHAVLCGLKVVAGIEYMMQIQQSKHQQQHGLLLLNHRTINEIPPSSTDERIQNWIQLISSSTSSSQHDPTSSWLLQCYQQGPNNSNIDISYILKCPVFIKERGFLTLYSNPNQSLIQQIKQGMKTTTNDDEDKDYPIPAKDLVDDDKWLEEMLSQQQQQQLPNDEEHNQNLENPINEEDTATLDKMLSKFQNFVIDDDDDNNDNGGGGGDHRGIESTTTTQPQQQQHDDSSDDDDDRSPSKSSSSITTIRPRIVLNLLHAVLKGDDNLMVFPAKEQQEFGDGGYDAAVEGGGGGGGGPTQHDDNEMENLMAAMDEELQSKTKLSRQLDGLQIVEESSSATTTTFAENVANAAGCGSTTSKNQNDDNNSGAVGDQKLSTATSSGGGDDESSHVLLNLLKSLEASGGNPGPVPNMMKEMGADIPKL